MDHSLAIAKYDKELRRLIDVVLGMSDTEQKASGEVRADDIRHRGDSRCGVFDFFYP